VTGFQDSSLPAETRLTTYAYYNGQESMSLHTNAPGGKPYRPRWNSLAQPLGQLKSINGPRIDVADLTTFVYYPIDNSVPAAARGQLAARSDALGHMTLFDDYDDFGHPRKITDPNNVVTIETYDPLGRLLTSTIQGIAKCDTTIDPLCGTPLTTSMAYDFSPNGTQPTGPLRSRVLPGGGTTLYTYDPDTRISEITRGPNAADQREKIAYQYDTLARKVAFERLLRKEGTSWAEKKTTQYSYDEFARLHRTFYPPYQSPLTSGDFEELAYDPMSSVASLKDAAHSTPNTLYFYDSLGRLSSVFQLRNAGTSDFIETDYTYDRQGHLVSVSDPSSNLTSYTVNDFGQTVRIDSPVTGITTMSFDLAGNVTSRTDARGIIDTRSYDALGRLTTVSYSDGTSASNFTYDETALGGFPIGRRTTTSSDTVTEFTTFSRTGMPSRTVQNFDIPFTTDRQFDLDGNLSRLTYPSGLIADYEYDWADRPAGVSTRFSLSEPTEPVVRSASYLPFGPLDSMEYEAQDATQLINETRTYDKRYRETAHSADGPAGNLFTFSYAHEGRGFLSSENGSGINSIVSYDDLGRLTSRVSTNGQAPFQEFYGYDEIGNRLSRHVVTSSSDITDVSAYQGSTARMATETESILGQNATIFPIVHDANGNILSDGRMTYSYDGANRIASFAPAGGNPMPIGYSADGFKAFEGTPGNGNAHFYLAAGPNRNYRSRIIFIQGGPLQIWDYLYFGDRVIGQFLNAPVFRLRPALQFTNSIGFPFLSLSSIDQTPQIYHADAFGSFIDPDARFLFDFRYPGQWTEALQSQASERELVENGFRTYVPSMGRYLQPDPMDRGDSNPYAYALNNPLRVVDPLGLWETDYGFSVTDFSWDQFNHGSPCPLNSPACTQRYYASVSCDCHCEGGSWSPRTVTLHARGQIFALTQMGWYQFQKGHRACDPLVHNRSTAIGHEFRQHILPSLDAVAPLVDALDDASFNNKEECESDCGRTSNAVAQGFREAMHDTQEQENTACGH